MKDNSILGISIDKYTSSMLSAFLQKDIYNFNIQTEFLRLDPQHDFQYADLRGVDFTGADLRHHNFTGADLRDAISTGGMQVDETTNLTDADVKGSVFAFSQRKKNIETYNPIFKKYIDRISKEHWTKQIDIILVMLKEKKYTDEISLYIANGVLEKTMDAIVRHDLLLGISSKLAEKSEHRDFIIDLLAKHKDNIAFQECAVKVISHMFHNDATCFSILLKESEHNFPRIRQVALRGLLLSRYRKANIKFIKNILDRETESFVRRSCVSIASKKLEIDESISKETACMFIDYHDVIDIKLITRKAMKYYQIDYEDRKKIEAKLNSENIKFLYQLKSYGYDRFCRKLISEINRMGKFGIPFRVEIPEK